jgi:hypothetical protein
MFELKRAKSLVSPQEACEEARREKKLAASKARADVLAEKRATQMDRVEGGAKRSREIGDIDVMRQADQGRQKLNRMTTQGTACTT